MSDERQIAMQIARRITDYWARFGHRVDVEIVREVPSSRPTNHHVAGYFVRSNMINGLPPKAKPDLINNLINTRHVNV